MMTCCVSVGNNNHMDDQVKQRRISTLGSCDFELCTGVMTAVAR